MIKNQDGADTVVHTASFFWRMSEKIQESPVAEFSPIESNEPPFQIQDALGASLMPKKSFLSLAPGTTWLNFIAYLCATLLSICLFVFLNASQV